MLPLRALGAAVLVEVEHDPQAHLRALADVVTCSTLSARPEGELVDRALERGDGHPLLAAIALQQIGRRGGLPVGIIAGESGDFVAHHRAPELIGGAHRCERVQYSSCASRSTPSNWRSRPASSHASRRC